MTFRLLYMCLCVHLGGLALELEYTAVIYMNTRIAGDDNINLAGENGWKQQTAHARTAHAPCCPAARTPAIKVNVHASTIYS